VNSEAGGTVSFRGVPFRGVSFRERLLARLRAGASGAAGDLFPAREAPVPAPPVARPEELRARFAAALRNVGGEVHDLVECRDLRGAFREVLSALRGGEEGAEPTQLAAIDGDPTWARLRGGPRPLDVAALASEAGYEVHELPAEGGASVDVLARTALGITAADLAVAETGSVAQFTRRWRPRSISLLPPTHLVVLPADRIVAALEDLLAHAGPELGGDSPYLTLITGPSRTADIEKVLTVGVHGPGRVVVVLLG
jgi:L-lactate dehydrogenase complex protein LldG